MYDKKITSKEKLKIETRAGIKDIELYIKNKTVTEVKVNMGKPEFELEKIPAYLPDLKSKSKISIANILIDKKEYKFNLVSMGNPHAICLCNNLNEINVAKCGPIVENFKIFPNKTNVEFAQVIDKSHIKAKVWERGVGQTIACGTGACACAVTAFYNGLVEKNVIVMLEGGNLHINIEKNIFMTGPAELSFEGKLFL